MDPVDSLAEEFIRDRAEMYRAMKAGNYVGALLLARAIVLYLASTPDQERDGHRQEWRNEMLAAIKQLEPLANQQSGTGGIQANKLEWRRPSLCTR